MKFERILLFVWLAFSASGAIRNVYFDSQAAGSGDGSLDNPFRTLSAVSFPAIQAWVNAGDDVHLQLKRGSVFRENFTFSASGTAAHPIRLQDYGAGAKPIISGEAVFTGWSLAGFGGGATWRLAAPNRVFYLWLENQYLTKGTSAGTLSDGAWVWESGQLYLRYDAGNPDTLTLSVTGAVRPNALRLNTVGSLIVSNLIFTKTSSYAASVTDANDIQFDDTEWLECGSQLNLNRSVNIAFRACRFEGSYGNQMALIEGPQTSASFVFCLFANQFVPAALQILSAASVLVANCNFVSVSGTSVSSAATGAVSLANCILTGHAIQTNTSGSDPIKSTGSPILVQNSLILPNGYNPSKHMVNVTEIGRNLYQDPRYVSVNRESILSLATDDYENLDDWIVFANLAKAKGWRAVLALSKTDTLKPSDKTKMQAMIDQGHEIASHSRSHAFLTTALGCYLKYVGTGSNCLLTIQGNRLKTIVSGGNGGENLDINLLQGNVDTTSELVSTLDAPPAYTCRLATIYSHAVPSRLLETVTDLDIALAEQFLPYNVPAFWTNEIWLSKEDIQSAFTAENGGPYSCRSFFYPGGAFDDAVVSQVIAAGYLGARADETSPVFSHMENMDLYHIPVPQGTTYGYVLMLRFERNTEDTSPQSNGFTGANLAYSPNAYRHSRAGDFNGTNTCVFRDANADFNFVRRDWHFSGRFWLRGQTGAGTLFSFTNAATAARIEVNDQLAVNFVVRSNAAEIFRLSTPPAAVSPGQYQKISVQQLFDRWFIRVNDVVVATTTNTLRLPAATGQVYIGCAANPDDGQLGNFYNGLMDDVVVSNGTYYKTQGLADMLCQFGGMMCTVSHNESGIPREILRIFLDALADYSGNLKVMTLSDALAYMRSRGVLSADGRSLKRYDLGHHADYHLRADSPCVCAGDPAVLQGIPSLHDLDGTPITDANGNLLLPGSGIDMGAFVNRNIGYSAPRLTMAPLKGGQSPKLLLVGQLGIRYQIDFSPDLSLWNPLTNLLCTDNPMVIEDPTNTPIRFYRAVVSGN